MPHDRSNSSNILRKSILKYCAAVAFERGLLPADFLPNFGEGGIKSSGRNAKCTVIQARPKPHELQHLRPNCTYCSKYLLAQREESFWALHDSLHHSQSPGNSELFVLGITNDFEPWTVNEIWSLGEDETFWNIRAQLDKICAFLHQEA